ncbi:hypothetical protein DCC39_05215 [Pueribacillus theae]|uniref:SCP domain-containing protein n=1 Tax=Pueribacillus theae TaxID=2171751 RepID=A0A2U1K6P0_9BACI|nr:CAP domain-containing protein [Pueribacillus theae]PWA12623.1 hypothetical protein DCC39_05215 [Pueribacillus theae]
MKKLLVATLIGAGLVGWQAGGAEAASTCNVQQKANVKYEVKQVPTYKWDYYYNWQNHYKDSKKDVNKNSNQQKAPEKNNDNVVQEKPAQPAPSQPVKEQPKNENQQQANQGLTAEEQQMLNLVNTERQKNGLKPLKANLELTKVARVKAKDMIDKGYFDHNSPTYGSPFDMMKQFGISYRTAGENLAGNQTVEKAHTSLMNSDGHRANILNSGYTEVGIGIVDGGQYGKMFVQMFIG